jgi:hypothetical protein
MVRSGSYRSAVACRQLYPQKSTFYPLHPCPRRSSRPVLGPRSGPGASYPLSWTLVRAGRSPASCLVPLSVGRSASGFIITALPLPGPSEPLSAGLAPLVTEPTPTRQRAPWCVPWPSWSMRRCPAPVPIFSVGCRRRSVGDASDGSSDVLGSADLPSLRDRSIPASWNPLSGLKGG